MASQPLNSNIAIHLRVRAYKQEFRHEAVKSLTGNGMRGQVVSVPGEEFLVGQTRVDMATHDREPTTAVQGNYSNPAIDTTGLPIVTMPETLPSVATVYAAVSNLDFPLRLPGMRDIQFGKQADALADDLYGQVRAANTSVRLTGAA